MAAEKYLVDFLTKTDKPSIPGKSSVKMFGGDIYKKAPNWVESMIISDDFAMMQGTPEGDEKIIHVGPDGHKGGPYPKWTKNADRMVFFYSTNPENMDSLEAEVEVYLGEGDEQEILKFSTPKCVFVPRGLRYGPVFIKNVKQNVMVTTILTTPTREDAEIITDFDYLP